MSKGEPISSLFEETCGSAGDGPSGRNNLDEAAGWVVPPRVTESIRWEEVDSPPRYARTTDKPVQYAAVVDRTGMILGYVWVNDEDDAAGWQYRRAGGDDAFNMGALWAAEFHESKQQGLAPSAALARMTRAYGPEDPSHIAPGSFAEAPTLQTVKDLAAKS